MNYLSIIKKQSFIITVSIIVMAIILIGTSYALFANQNNSNTQVVSSGTLIVNYEGTAITTTGGIDNGGNLLEIEPMDEETVNSLTPFKIVVNNTGTLAMKYNIVLYTDTTNTLPHSYYAFKYKNNGTYTTKAALTTLSKVDPTQTNMNEIVYKLTSEPFVIEPNTSATHELYVWIDEDYADENISDKVAYLKIAVQGEATDVTPPNAVQTITELATTDNTIVDDETNDHNLRYIGSNPNNYVSFNNELWRIIGVMNNIQTQSGQTKPLLKITRSDLLGSYSWDTSASDVNDSNGVNEWSQSDLMYELNTDYLGNVTIGTDGYWYDDYNNSKSAAKPSSTISSTAQDMIETISWKLGSPNNDNGTYVDYSINTFTPSYIYAHESSSFSGKICSSGQYCNDSITRTTSWNGKVGLVYLSDYAYATSGGNTTNRSTCLGLGLFSGWINSSYEDCKNNDWIYNSSTYQWTMSPLTNATHSTLVFYVRGDSDSRHGAYHNYGVRPTLYLKSSVKITGGEGTQANPYILE